MISPLRATSVPPPCLRVESGARRGFTLIELMVVVTILGLVTSVVILRSGVTQGKARFEQTLVQLETLDARIRTQARRFGREESLEIPIKRDHVIRDEDHEVPLGRGTTITRYVSPARTTSSGKVTVHYGVDGGSHTFALRITGRSDRETWLLFAGETGHVTRLDDEKQVTNIIDALRPNAG